jgi:hypothetical protein
MINVVSTAAQQAAQLVRDEIKRAMAPPPGFVVHNATDEDIEITFDGETLVIPNFDRVVLPHPIFAHVPHSAQDVDGDYIPGTLLICNKEGDRGTPFNNKGAWIAAQAIKHCLDIDVTTGIASGPYYKRGLTVMPSLPTKDTVQQIMVDGRSRYEVWRLGWAKETVEAFNDRASKWRALNLQPQAPPIDYDIAKELLDREAEKRKLEVKKKLDGKTPPPELQPEPATKESVFAELMNDPEMLKTLLAKMKEAAKTKAE